MYMCRLKLKIYTFIPSKPAMDVQIVLEMMVNDFESNMARTKYCILFHAHVYLQVFSTKGICML